MLSYNHGVLGGETQLTRSEGGALFPNRHSARRARAGPGEGPSARGPTSDNGRLSEAIR